MEVRRGIEREVVDGMAYVRTREEIALTKQRMQKVSREKLIWPVDQA